MNYLAHIFLSGTDRKIQLGNFIGDAVKGNSYKNYPQTIAEGVLLHRAIDTYTDNHPAVREAVSMLKPQFGRYSAVLLDIYFDYLLASRFSLFSDIPLKRFARRFYYTVIWNYPTLPKRIKRFIWHFISTDRLTKYATKKGIRRSLEIMFSVHGIEISVDESIQYLTEKEEELFAVFHPFFLEIRGFCQNYIRTRKE